MGTNQRLVWVLIVFLFWIAGIGLSFGQGGGVEVTAKALDFTNEAAEIQRFEVELTTHSVNLDFDLAKVALLGDEKGELVSADSWTGGRGGHHLSGILSFPGKRLIGFRSLQLILDLPNLGKRVFSWPSEAKGAN